MPYATLFVQAIDYAVQRQSRMDKKGVTPLRQSHVEYWLALAIGYASV